MAKADHDRAVSDVIPTTLEHRMNTSLSRRALLARAAYGVGLLAALPRALPAIDPPAVEQPSGACLKPALNAYSFLERLQAKEPAAAIDLFAVCEFAAREEFAAVDLTGYFFPGYPAPPPTEYITRIKRRLHVLGLDLSGTGVRNDFATADAQVRANGVRLVQDWIAVAADLGAPVIRVFAGPQAPFRDWEKAAPGASRADVETWMAEALHACAETGKQHGVLVAVQNHGDFLSTGQQHLNLLNRVGHDWCGALVDTGKYLTDDPYADIALVAPRALNWQIKENVHSTQQSPAVDLGKLVSIIRASGYRGYLPIETLSMGRRDYDPYQAVRTIHGILRKALRDDRQ
jgi:sugar phosphate isomerase/epimerase